LVIFNRTAKVGCMNKYDLSSRRKQSLSEIPEGCGVFFFSDGTHILYTGKTGNLKRTLAQFIYAQEPDAKLKAMLDSATVLEWEAKETLLECLLWQKRVFSSTEPLLQSKIRTYDDYGYLAINFEKAPFMFISENTGDADCYIGPFRDRFFLYDLMEIISEILRLPICPQDEFPCERSHNDLCPAYCLKEDNTKLIHLIRQTYLVPTPILVHTLKTKYDKLFDELEFEEADRVQWKMLQLRKYYDFLKFFYIAKHMNLVISDAHGSYHVTNGLLSSYTSNEGAVEKFQAVVQPEYRDAEYLAVNKDQLDEMWIIYQQAKQTQPELLEDIYLKSLTSGLALLGH
jgi:excinuclease UvrABC nuclease subunit